MCGSADAGAAAAVVAAVVTRAAPDDTAAGRASDCRQDEEATGPEGEGRRDEEPLWRLRRLACWPALSDLRLFLPPCRVIFARLACLMSRRAGLKADEVNKKPSAEHAEGEAPRALDAESEKSGRELGLDYCTGFALYNLKTRYAVCGTAAPSTLLNPNPNSIARPRQENFRARHDTLFLDVRAKYCTTELYIARRRHLIYEY